MKPQPTTFGNRLKKAFDGNMLEFDWCVPFYNTGLRVPHSDAIWPPQSVLNEEAPGQKMIRGKYVEARQIEAEDVVFLKRNSSSSSPLSVQRSFDFIDILEKKQYDGMDVNFSKAIFWCLGSSIESWCQESHLDRMFIYTDI